MRETSIQSSKHQEPKIVAEKFYSWKAFIGTRTSTYVTILNISHNIKAKSNPEKALITLMHNFWSRLALSRRQAPLFRQIVTFHWLAMSEKFANDLKSA
jgi:hypothetical protein